jgi:nucleoside-diphosphate-sugar epimerase
MRAIVTGAAGWIGEKFQEYLRANPDIDLEFLIAIDGADEPPGFGNSIPEYQWLTVDLDGVNWEWWLNLVEGNNIDTVFFIETYENDNLCEPGEPDYAHNRRYQLVDLHFVDYLNHRMTTEPEDYLKVMYLSTDKVFLNDPFPNETHELKFQPVHDPVEGLMEDKGYFYSYAAIKLNTELNLLQNPSIEVRIIRPFALTDKDRNHNCPVFKMVNDILIRRDVELFEDGSYGVAITHLDDLIEFMASPKLFDPLVKEKLTSRIINFSRVWNYLTVTQMAKKISNKMNIPANLVYDSGFNSFASVMQTPQIRNMMQIMKPRKTIEMILEEIIYELNPVNHYAPFVVDEPVISDPQIMLSGTVEPVSSIAVFFGNGDSFIIDADGSGNWSGTKETFTSFLYPIELYATTIDGIQYASTVINGTNQP